MKLNLDIQTLRSFVAIWKVGSFTKAADILRMTQPSMSQQIRRLEELLNAELLVRENRTVRLTVAGEKLLRYAHQMIEINDSIGEAFQSSDRKEVVHLGMPEHFSDLVLPKIIGEINELFPNVQLVVKVARATMIAEMIESGKVDLGIIIDEVGEQTNERSHEIAVKWFSSEDSKLTPYKEIPLVLFRPPCSFRSLAIRCLEERGLAWRCAYESEDLISLRSAVIADVGITILPFIRDVRGLRNIESNNVLPVLPRFEVFLRQRTGWNPAFKKVLSNKVLNVWNDFENEARMETRGHSQTIASH